MSDSGIKQEERHDERKLSNGIPPNLLVSQLAALDTTPWYQKPNLRLLYFIIFPTCIGVEMTSGSVVSCDPCKHFFIFFFRVQIRFLDDERSTSSELMG